MLRVFTVLLVLLWTNVVYGFIFKYNNTEPNRIYRLFSSSLQNVEQNTSIKQATFEQAYEAFLRPTHTDSSKNTVDLQGDFSYSYRLYGSDEPFSKVGFQKIYKTAFKRMSNGKVEVFSETDIYPSVRSVPTFPSIDLSVGDTWSDTGKEVQDFSVIGYKDPFIVPFTASYEYIGDISLSTTDLQTLIKEYKKYDFSIPKERLKYKQNINLYHKVKEDIAVLYVKYIVDYKYVDNMSQTLNMRKQNGNPVTKAQGYYNGLVFWDKQKQYHILSIGEYDFTYIWENKEKRNWSGKEYGIVNFMYKDEQLKNNIAKAAESIDSNMEVLKEPQGVKLILGDLLFNFNKTTLRPEVQETLFKILNLLKENSQTAVHITGHSDDIGTEKAKSEIAEGRAKSVANFFVQYGIDSSRISFDSKSDKEPRFPNSNASNRKKNRRVEIDIITE